MPQSRRVTYWSVISIRMGQIVFTTYGLWTLTLSPIHQIHQKSFFKTQNGQRRKCTWRHASSNVNIFAVCHLHWWDTGCGGVGYPANNNQPPRNKVATYLLQDMQIRQEYYCHHIGVGHTTVHPGSRVLAHKISIQRLQWEYGAGINMFR